MEIYKATAADWESISQMAEQSWRTGYAGILAEEQIDFMLNRSYKEQGFAEATQNGDAFFILRDEGVNVGFITILPKAALLRIEKLYLVPTGQGKGYGKQLINFAAEKAAELGLPCLELNVNRGNTNAYNFYLKQGFVVTETVDIPYFAYVLDDFVMQRKLV